MRTEKEIRKMLKTATQHPERFSPSDSKTVVEVLKWVLGELPISRGSE